MDTPQRAQHKLILISGAVASGKTTLAWRLAALSRERAMPAAAIDIDELFAIVAGRDWSLVTSIHRRLACELAATVAQRLFEGNVTLVAIAGSTVSPHEWQHVQSNLNAAPLATRVLLRVSLAEAVRRAREDFTRVGATRDSGVVARLHFAIDWSGVPKPDIELDTDGLTQDEVAQAVWGRLQRGVDLPT